MINKNNKKILSLSAGAMSALMFMASVSMPVYAADNKIEYAYNQSALNKDSFNGKYVIEQNGAKLTVTKIEATRNRIEVTMELQSNRTDLNGFEHDNLDLRVKMNDVEEDGGGGGRSDNGNGKILIEERIENKDGFPEKGVIRIDAIDGVLGLNGTLKIPVDFTQDFNDVFNKDINKSINVNGTEVNIERFESNKLETSIITSQSVEGTTRSFRHRIHDQNLSFLVNLDGNLYLSNYPHYSEDKDGREYDNYVADDLTYDKVKNAEKITIRQVSNSMTNEEMDDFYNRDEDRESSDKYMKEQSGVKYPEKIIFSEGAEGDINVVRENDKIKVYCSSDSELKSMMMALNLYGAYADDKTYYDQLVGRTIYKDKDNENQYVVQYDDTEKNQKVSFHCDQIISNIDKYSLGEEMEIK